MSTRITWLKHNLVRNWLSLNYSFAFFSRFYMSRESGQDTVRIHPFTHVAHNRRLSMSDAFSPTGNTRFGLGEGWHLGQACRRKRRTPPQWLFLCWYHHYMHFDVPTISTKGWKATYTHSLRDNDLLHSHVGLISALGSVGHLSNPLDKNKSVISALWLHYLPQSQRRQCGRVMSLSG